MPAYLVIGRILVKLRTGLVAATDARIKLVTEVVNGIKAIKLYAWEMPYINRI